MLVILVLLHSIYLLAEAHSDITSDEAVRNDTRHIWHSYEFDSGVGNREELYFKHVGLNKNFATDSEIFAWKSLQIQGEVVLIGLGKNHLYITTYRDENDTFISKEELRDLAGNLMVLQKWDSNSQVMQSYVIVSVSTSKNLFTIKWFKLENRQLKFLYDWQFHRIITYMDIIKVNHESKLIIVSHLDEIQRNSTIDIYNFNLLPQLDIWQFERIVLDDIPSSVAIFSDTYNTFVAASVPSAGAIYIWKYSKALCLSSLDQNYFKFQQKIYSDDLKSITAFQHGFQWYLAVASNNSSIYKMNENLLFYPVNIKLGIKNNWLAVPIDTYREDVILLSGSKNKLVVTVWSGNGKIETMKNFTETLCRDDWRCSLKMNEVLLTEATVFKYNGYHNILIPTKNGSSFILKLMIKLRPLLDKVSLQLNDIQKLKKELEKNYFIQADEIRKLTINKSLSLPYIKINPSEKLETYSKLKELNSTFLQSEESNVNLDSLSLTKNWTNVEENLKLLNSRIDSLMIVIKKLNDSNSGQFSSLFGPAERTSLPSNISDGITFHGKVIINNINLTTVNGFIINDLMKKSFRKNSRRKIGGVKRLKTVNVKSVAFEKIKNISACDIVFSDDLWEQANGNVINGDIILDAKIDILNTFKVRNEDAQYENIFKKKKYDFAHFESLEIAEETNVKYNINSRPLIFPIHNVPLNVHYLDSVNQARVEFVNVKSNLSVGLLNGKNMSDVIQQIFFKNNNPLMKHDLKKVEGVLQVRYLEADALDLLDVDSYENALDSKAKANVDHPIHNILHSDFKRNIFVFENLEVDGLLQTNEINYLNWNILNDTILKRAPSAIVNGAKIFKKPLNAKNLKINGRLNDSPVDNVLKDFSDQTIYFSQTFNNVNFINLSLNGTWNGTDMAQLKDSVTLSPFNGCNKCNLTLEPNSTLFIKNLTITNFINNINLRDKSINSKRNLYIDNSIVLNTIKASKAIINGSLITNDKVNGINMTEFNRRRVSLKEPQTIERSISQSNVRFSGNINIYFLNDNAISSIVNFEGDNETIKEFLSGEIYKIKKLLVKGHINISEELNDNNLNRVSENWICLTKANSLNGNTVFENIVHFDYLNVTNTIDGFSLKKLETDIAFKHAHVFINGEKHFPAIKVVRDMKSRLLNNHLVQNIVTLKGDHTMKGSVKINGNVIVKGNITTNGKLNDINMPQLLDRFSTLHDSYIFTKNLTFNNYGLTINNLLVGGNIQNISFNAFMDNVISKADSFHVYGTKIFKGKVIFKGNVLVKKTINNVNFEELFNEIAYVNQPTKISGSVLFREAILNVVSIRDYFNSSLFNDFDINDWFEDSIPLDRWDVINGKMKFETPHVMDNSLVDFINGHISSAVIPLQGKQYIPVMGVFSRINVTSDLNVEGLVNGVNLMNEFDDSILSTGDQVFNNNIIFYNDFVINGSLLVTSVRGKSIEDLITLDTEQTITSNLNFNGSVTVKRNIENLKFINGINLKDWNDRSVLLNREQKIKGLWTSKGTIKAKDISGKATLGSNSLSDISKGVRQSKMMAERRKNETEVEYHSQCRAIEKLSRDFVKLPYLFHQFEVAHVIDTPSTIESSISLKIGGLDYMITTFVRECFSAFYKWNQHNSTFSYLKYINIGPVSKWLVSYHNNATYLITSSFYNSMECEEHLQQGNIWIFDENFDHYGHVLTANAFIDITQENDTSGSFYTIDKNGSIFRWIIENSKNVAPSFLVSVGHANYRFLDFKITGSLAVSSGMEIKKIILGGPEIVVDNISVPYGNIVALPIDGKVFVASVLKDKIIIYENIWKEKIFTVLNVFKAGSVLWFNYGSGKQAFLITLSQHKLIEVFEYKSVSGFIRRMSLQLFSARLQSFLLPSNKKYQLSKFVVVIQKNKIVLLEANMMGDFFEENNTLC